MSALRSRIGLPLDVFSTALKHRNLIAALARRDISGRYRGSALGTTWAVVTPLLMLLVYTFVFGIVFKSRWRSDSNNAFEFAVTMFSGLIVHGLLAEVVNRSPGLVTQNVNFVKKIVFPLEVLPWVAIAAASFHFVVSFAVLLAGVALTFGTLHWSVMLAPLVMLPLVPVILGLSWFLASLGVFLRDLPQLVPVATTVLLFLAPVFYPLTSVPEKLRWFVNVNPLTPVIENFRAVVIWGVVPDPFGIIVYAFTATAFAWVGLLWFGATRKGFADVV